MGGNKDHVLQVDSVTLSGLLIRCYACTSYLVTQSWLPPWSGPKWCLVFAVRSGLRPNMVPPIGPEVRGRNLQLDALKPQHFLDTVSFFIGERYCLWKNCLSGSENCQRSWNKTTTKCKSCQETQGLVSGSPEVIKKIKRWTAQEDPPKQRYMAQ